MSEVRRADIADVTELVRLRVQMFSDMGRDTSTFDDTWWRLNAERFTARLRQPDEFAAFVVDKPDGGLAACAAGWLDEHLVGAANPLGRVGYVANMCTDPAFRGRGYARATLSAVVEWMRGIGVPSVSLHASPDGEHLYRSLGFIEPDNPYLTLRLQ